MTEDKKIEQLIAMGAKSITISKEKYDSLKEETQKRKLDKVLDIFDKYRKDIKISRKKYEEVIDKKREEQK